MGGRLVELSQKLGGDGLHGDRLHLDAAKKITVGNEAGNSHGQSSDRRIEGLRDPTGNHNRIPCPAERSEDPNKTGKRAGVLSTTGQSTNFIINVDMPTKVQPGTWVRRAAAMLC